MRSYEAEHDIVYLDKTHLCTWKTLCLVSFLFADCYRKRASYIAYLTRCRQGLQSTQAHLERLLQRVLRDKELSTRYFTTVCVRLLLESKEKRIQEFIQGRIGNGLGYLGGGDPTAQKLCPLFHSGTHISGRRSPPSGRCQWVFLSPTGCSCQIKRGGQSRGSPAAWKEQSCNLILTRVRMETVR